MEVNKDIISRCSSIKSILFSENDIQEKINELRNKILTDYNNVVDDIVFLSVLKGSYIFTSDLTKSIFFSNKKVFVDFIQLSSYNGGLETSGKINIVNSSKGLDYLENKHVIILEDIVDTGNTIKWLKEYLANKNTASVKICCLLDKKARRTVDLDIDYIGFDCPDEFVIGYGMDYGEEFRTLPFICIYN